VVDGHVGGFTFYTKLQPFALKIIAYFYNNNHVDQVLLFNFQDNKTKNKLWGFNPSENYTDRATAAFRRS
jgi:hypothetical protein